MMMLNAKVSAAKALISFSLSIALFPVDLGVILIPRTLGN